MRNKKKFVYISISILLYVFLAFGLLNTPVVALAQDPTVTSTAIDTVVEVKAQEQSQINIRSGPGMNYPIVGILLAGQKVPAKGISSGGDWIEIDYPGVQGGRAWIYTTLVNITGKPLPTVNPPPKPTLRYTPTVDPTLVARFEITTVPTRLPTFTAPAPLSIPTFTDDSGSRSIAGIPMGFVIIVLAGAGILIGLFTLIQNR